MLVRAPNIKNLDNLREFVTKTFCLQHHLMLGAFRMTEHPLLRKGKPCGILFCLHGPRAVKFTAVWETERNTVLFYGSAGERLEKIQLVQSLAEGLERQPA
jgi:hypothetical protein